MAVLYLSFTDNLPVLTGLQVDWKSRVFILFSLEAHGARGLVPSPTFRSRGPEPERSLIKAGRRRLSPEPTGSGLTTLTWSGFSLLLNFFQKQEHI